MTDFEIPDDTFVVRYAKPSLINDDRISGAVFVLRSEDEGLSVNWLDFFENCNKEKQLDKVKESSQMSMNKNGRLAELNVGITKKHLVGELESINFKHKPCDDDPSHSEVFGLPSGDTPEAELIGDMIAQTVTAVYPTAKSD